MRTNTNISIIDIGRVKWAARNGWSPYRTAIILGLPLSAVCWALGADYSGPELPIH